MWFLQALVPMLTMLIGFLCGIMATDSFTADNRMDKMERKIRRLERRIKDEV